MKNEKKLYQILGLIEHSYTEQVRSDVIRHIDTFLEKNGIKAHEGIKIF